MFQDVLQIEITADVDDDGTKETGVFEISGGAEGQASYTEEVQIDPIIGGSAQNINSAIQQYIFGENHRRRGIYIENGGGAHIFDIQFNGWEGSSNQWGDGSGTLPADATGEGPRRQIQIFQNYLRKGSIDSLNPAVVQFGEYNPNGSLDDQLYMFVGSPTLTNSVTAEKTFDGTMQLVEIERLDIPIDILERLGI